MEGEIKNFLVVWITVLASLCYCHTIAKFIPKGTIRFLAILPISCLYIFLPLKLTSINIGTTSCFLISWLTNFKILLFAFGTGPLASDPPLPLSHFISLACLPIKIQQPKQQSKKCPPQDFHPKGYKSHGNHVANRTFKVYPSQEFGQNVAKSEFQEHPSQEFPQNGDKSIANQEFKDYPSQEIPKKGHKSLSNYVIKILLLATLIKLYDYKEHLNSNLVYLLYCFHIYFTLELFLAMFAALARNLLEAELEPQFDDPYLATSLQDFWGRRWNLMVSNILRPAVFQPVRRLSTAMIGKKLASLPAVVGVFFVSGLMHELIFYSFGRQKTNWQAMCFFLLHGVAVVVEIVVKKMVAGKFRLPAVISRPMTLTFVLVTSFWLFFPPFLRGNAEGKACTEVLAFVEFLKSGRLISPENFTCPLL